MAKRYFEYKDAKSKKFLEVSVSGKKVNIPYGKIGTDGQNLAERTKYSSRSQGACREAGSGQSEEGVQGSLKTKGKADRWKHKTICIRGQGKEHVLLM